MHSENSIQFYKCSAKYYRHYYKIRPVTVIAILHLRHRGSVAHRAVQAMAQGHTADLGSKILRLASKTQLNLPNAIDQSRKHGPNHDTGFTRVCRYSTKLCFIKDVSMKRSVLQYRAYVVHIVFLPPTHS